MGKQYLIIFFKSIKNILPNKNTSDEYLENIFWDIIWAKNIIRRNMLVKNGWIKIMLKNKYRWMPNLRAKAKSRKMNINIICKNFVMVS